MNCISARRFNPYRDVDAVWRFLVEIYDVHRANGVPAPFFEHALTASWFDASYLYLDRLWLDGGRIVGLVFYEDPVTDVYFCLRPGYEALAGEMVAYAREAMPNWDGEQRLVLFAGQTALIQAAAGRGYRQVDTFQEYLFDFNGELDHRLPAGFRFVPAAEIDLVKLGRCCWKGFDHEAAHGPFVNWDARDEGADWTPAKAMKGMYRLAPHATDECALVIADAAGEYACYAGMWWVPENRLAYMEPLCTVPEHRRKGLAAAALSEHCRRLKPLGATHMTGGGDPFYRAIGYEPAITWTFWKRRE